MTNRYVRLSRNLKNQNEPASNSGPQIPHTPFQTVLNRRRSRFSSPPPPRVRTNEDDVASTRRYFYLLLSSFFFIFFYIFKFIFSKGGNCYCQGCGVTSLKLPFGPQSLPNYIIMSRSVLKNFEPTNKKI